MNRFFCKFFGLLLIVGLVACGGGTDQISTSKTNSVRVEKQFVIGPQLDAQLALLAKIDSPGTDQGGAFCGQYAGLYNLTAVRCPSSKTTKTLKSAVDVLKKTKMTEEYDCKEKAGTFACTTKLLKFVLHGPFQDQNFILGQKISEQQFVVAAGQFTKDDTANLTLSHVIKSEDGKGMCMATYQVALSQTAKTGCDGAPTNKK